MIITMVTFTGEYITGNAIISTLLGIAFYILIHKLKLGKRRKIKQEEANDKKIIKRISIGFYLGVANIIVLLFVLFLINYIQ